MERRHKVTISGIAMWFGEARAHFAGIEEDAPPHNFTMSPSDRRCFFRRLFDRSPASASPVLCKLLRFISEIAAEAQVAGWDVLAPAHRANFDARENRRGANFVHMDGDASMAFTQICS